MNNVILIGRLTKDPELKYIPSTGNAATNFSIAVDRAYTPKDGQKQTDFFNIQTWGKTAENVANYLSKGKLCAVKGSIQNRSYEKDGVKKYITEIVADRVQFLESANTAKDDSAAVEFDESGFRALEDEDVPF